MIRGREMKRQNHPRLPTLQNQQGVALVVSLIFLVVMTMLGVTVLKTSSLEENMARNMQESVRAFAHSETGVTRALQDINAFTTADSHSGNSTTVTLSNGSATYSRRHLGSTPPERKPDTATGSGTKYVHFEVRSEGLTFMNARATIDQGGYIEAPSSDGVLIEGY